MITAPKKAESRNQVKISKNTTFLRFFAFFLVSGALGCGAEAETLEIDQTHAALQADNNFGYDDANQYRACGSVSPVGTCYYPFGFGDGDDADASAMWTICVNFAGMSTAQLTRTGNAINAVIAELEPHGVSLEVTRVGNCDSGQLIHIVKGAVTSEGLNPIRSYGRTACQSSALLGESPAIDGTHRTCFRHLITLDLNDLDAWARCSAWPRSVSGSRAHPRMTCAGRAPSAPATPSSGSTSRRTAAPRRRRTRSTPRSSTSPIRAATDRNNATAGLSRGGQSPPGKLGGLSSFRLHIRGSFPPRCVILLGRSFGVRFLRGVLILLGRSFGARFLRGVLI
jgi:hypothetical protein